MSEPEDTYQPSYQPLDADVPWLSLETFAHHGDPGEPAYLLLCPICGFEYNHHAGMAIIDGHDHYKAWQGRGDVTRLMFNGECGHRWSLRFGFHKGNIYVFWQDEGMVPDFNSGGESADDANANIP